MRKIKLYKSFLESFKTTGKVDGISISADGAEFSMVFEFGDVDAELTKDGETYDIRFLVVQPSDGSVLDDLWYVCIDSEDEDSIQNCKNLGIELVDNNRISNNEIKEFILECYSQSNESSEMIDDIEINVTNISPSHIIESGYVMTTCEKDGVSHNINFDVIQPSNSDWYVAIDDDDLRKLKEMGSKIEVKEIEFTAGYVYNCIQGDDFNFILDWYDGISNEKRGDWR